MSCLTSPQLCGFKEFVLRGPALSIPAKGWRVRDLPDAGAHLQHAWDSHHTEPRTSKQAWAEMYDFLKANGVIVNPQLIVEEGIRQYCSEEPLRCPRKYRTRTIKAPRLPWAKDAWEASNHALSADLEPGEVRAVLRTVVGNLTRLISSPTGCPKCARHWEEVLQKNPVPAEVTLTEARQWLWARHNETREGKEPEPWEKIRDKFWPEAASASVPPEPPADDPPVEDPPADDSEPSDPLPE